MYVVITRVPVKEGAIEDLLERFKQTNPDLVADQPDWVEAKFTADPEGKSITVLAFWRNADSYRAYSAGPKFREVMGSFAPYFAGPPEVSINEVLFEM